MKPVLAVRDLSAATSAAAGESASRPKAGRPPSTPAPRARILHEAARLFATEGFERSSIADLAHALGLSKPAIYHYFRTKQEIYDAIIAAVLDGLFAAVRQAVQTSDEAPARLRLFMTAHADYFEHHHAEFVTMLIGFSGMAGGDRLEVAKRRDDYEALLRQIIARGVDEGDFKPTDVKSAARAVLSMLNWMARWYKPGHGERARDIALNYYDLAAGGLLVAHKDDKEKR